MEGEEQQGRPKLIETTILENQRIGYQTAIQLLTTELGITWTRYTAMLVTNSILLAAIATFAREENQTALTEVGSVLIAIIGLVVCFAWYSVNSRGAIYHKYWILSARELEKQLQGIKTLTRGERLSKGDKILVDGEPIEMKFVSRIPIVDTSRFIMLVFGILYLAYIVYKYMHSNNEQRTILLCVIIPFMLVAIIYFVCKVRRKVRR